MKEYFVKFGIPILVVVLIIIITIITIKSTKEDNDRTSYVTLWQETSNHSLLLFDKDRNYKKVKINDILTYADSLIQQMVSDILTDMSDGYISSVYNTVLDENKNIIDTSFTDIYDKNILIFMNKLKQDTGSIISLKQPDRKTNPDMAFALSKANSIIDNSSLSTNIKIGAGNSYNLSTKAYGFAYLWATVSDGDIIKLGRPPFENQRVPLRLEIYSFP
jgi:hypothetical protein